MNYKVQAICIDTNIIKKILSKRPYSLSEVIYKTILKTKDKYIISGAWVIEKSPLIDEMYNKRYCG